MKLKISILIACAMLLCASAFLPNIITSSVPKVEVTRIISTAYNQYLSCSGSIEEEKRNNIKTDIPVILSSIDVEVGDSVSKGQCLATIDKSATIKSYSNLGSVASASALLGGSISGIPSEILLQAANSDKSAIEDYIKTTQTAIKTLPSSLTSPVDGVVTAINANEDELTGVGTAIISVAQTDKLIAKVSVNETSISKVKIGQSAVVTIIADGSKKYSCTVTKIYPTARTSITGMGGDAVVDVVLSIDKPDEAIKPGYTAKARIMVQSAKHSLLLPYEAVGQDEKNNEFVYVYSNGKAEKRIIITGVELVSGVEAVDGVKEGEIIILSPDKIKKDGELVMVTKK